MPAQIILAQDLREPHAAVERIVANGLGHQHCQLPAAAGGGRQPGFTMLVTQPNSATTADRCYNSLRQKTTDPHRRQHEVANGQVI